MQYDFFSNNTTSSIFILVALFITVFPPTVRSNPNFLKLPSDRLPESVCPVKNLDPVVCPVKCFRPDPVCGVNGVTYWCGCADAQCAGIFVQKLGFCEVGIGGGSAGQQALLLVHMLWMILLGVFLIFGML